EQDQQRHDPHVLILPERYCLHDRPSGEKASASLPSYPSKAVDTFRSVALALCGLSISPRMCRGKLVGGHPRRTTTNGHAFVLHFARNGGQSAISPSAVPFTRARLNISLHKDLGRHPEHGTVLAFRLDVAGPRNLLYARERPFLRHPHVPPARRGRDG